MSRFFRREKNINCDCVDTIILGLRFGYCNHNYFYITQESVDKEVAKYLALNKMIKKSLKKYKNSKIGG